MRWPFRRRRGRHRVGPAAPAVEEVLARPVPEPLLPADPAWSSLAEAALGRGGEALGRGVVGEPGGGAGSDGAPVPAPVATVSAAVPAVPDADAVDLLPGEPVEVPVPVPVAEPVRVPEPPVLRLHVELGFRDGSTTTLAPDSPQARALEEIARVLSSTDPGL